MKNKSNKRSVENLQQLYTVVIGLSLSLAIERIINLDPAANFPIYFDRLYLFFTFLIFLIPVYHGAMRHLDISYIETENKNSFALIFDFIILFIEGCFFLLLAGLLPNTFGFLTILIILLFIDFVWAGIAYFGFATDKDEKKAIGTWGLLNLITGAFIIIGTVYYRSLDSNVYPIVIFISVSLLVVMFIRSLLDYILCWNLYYPRSK